MQRIQLKTHIGADGVLRVQMPPEFKNRDLEAILIVELLAEQELIEPPKFSGWQPGFFTEVIGSWVGEPLVREEQGDYEIREKLF